MIRETESRIALVMNCRVLTRLFRANFCLPAEQRVIKLDQVFALLLRVDHLVEPARFAVVVLFEFRHDPERSAE